MNPSQSILQPDQTHPLTRAFSGWGGWLMGLLGASMLALLSIGFYYALDWFNIDVPKPLQGETWIWLLGGILGAAGYVLLIWKLVQAPWLLILFLLSVSRIFGFLSHLGDTSGFHFPGRVMSIAILVPPCLILLIKNWRGLWHDLPYFKGIIGFTAITLAYYFFYNSPFIDPRGATVEYTSPSKDFLVVAFFVNFAVIAGYCGMKQAKNKTQVFDWLNSIILWYGLLEAVMVFLGYPFGQFSRYIDGFLRVEGTAKHPNHFAHQQATFLLYTLGLIGYYAYRPIQLGKKLPKFLLIGTPVLMGITYLMALSKSSLGVLLACIFMYLIVLSFCLKVKKPLIWTLVILPVLIPLVLTAYDLATGDSFLQILQARISNEGSYTWRMNMWNGLLNNIDSTSMWLGHGLSSSRELQFMLHNDVSKVESATSQVHNASIQLFYDMGFLGFVYYLSFVAYGWQLSRYWPALKGVPSLRFLMVSAYFMMVYFFVVAHFDESMFNYTFSSIFWVLLTVILLYLGSMHRHFKTLVQVSAPP